MPLISIVVVISSMEREKELHSLADSLKIQTFKDFEIILVENGVNCSNEQIALFNGMDLKQVKSEINTGVAGGRNIGIKNSSGKFVIFIDDDACFSSNEDIQNIIRSFDRYPSAGALSFKIEDIKPESRGKNIDHGGYPVRRGKRLDSDTACSYFFGGACAFRKKIFEDIGLLPEEYFFGCEELDFSFRLMEKGIDIFFIPDVKIKHFMSPSGKSEGQRSYYLIKNRINVAFKYLPLRYAIIHSLLWSVFVFLESMRTSSLKHYLKGLVHGIKKIQAVRKDDNVLSAETIKKINKLMGRTYY
ncbi:MAG: glycosyltransferase [Candidatus Schekmanbacteria bacterium]|nr:glycosyltransferase [Candidatus Schekmanbacteria bacterium]